MLSIALFLYRGVYQTIDQSRGFRNNDADFQAYYAAGTIWNRGDNPYDYDTFWRQYREGGDLDWDGVMFYSYVYPPQASAMFGMLALVPPETARLGFIALNVLLALGMCWMLLHILSWYRPIGLAELALVASLLNTGVVRTNLRGQMGLIICSIVLAGLIFLRSRRDVAAGVTLALLSIKPTNVLLYLGYSLLRRPRLMAIAFITTGALLTVAPMLISGRSVVETLMIWLAQIGRLQGTDYRSPLLPYSAVMVQTEILVFRVLNEISPAAKLVSSIITLALAGLSFAAILRHGARDESLLLDMALISALTLVSSYHLTHDMGLLFPGLLCIYLLAASHRARRARWLWGLFLVGLIVLMSVPGSLLTDQVPRLVGLPLHTYYWYRLIVPFQAWLSLAVFGTLLWLKASPRRSGVLMLPPVSLYQRQSSAIGEQALAWTPQQAAADSDRD
ncbi:MAG: DUF2029 domain-containing protein [Chloroflexales bacterium]|nr:DUF2029 domain-containing protein [Chloroflexales bacterium]